MLFTNSIVASVALFASLAAQVSAHGTITAVTGANGVVGQGFGIIPSTPRDGSSPKPFEQDTSIIRDREFASGKAGACGRTPGGGNNDVASQLAAASAAGLPSCSADGTVTMTVHQVNQDGAGPYSCDVSTDGGNTFTDATVTKNVPGKFSLSTAKATDFELVAQMPAGTTCAGGPNGDACVMRCRNQALAGPFGSCVAVTNNDGGAAAAGTAANSTAAGAGTAAAGTTAAGTTGAGTAAAGTTGAGTTAAGVAANKKRLTNSRVAGKRAGWWIEA